MKPKVLVSGGVGFIGSHLVSRLNQLGYPTTVIDRLAQGPGRRDISDPRLGDLIVKLKPEIIFHLAAESSVTAAAEEILRSNIIGTYNLLLAGQQAKIKKFIFTSSAAVYGEAKSFPIKETAALKPISTYGLSKLTGELYCRQFNDSFPSVIFRLANVYGPGQKFTNEGGVVAIFLHQAKHGRTPLIYGSGQQTRDFIYVADVVEALVRAIKSPEKGIFNLGTGQETSINQLAQLICPGRPFKHLPARRQDIVRSVLASSWQPRVKLSQGLDLCRNFLS